MEVLLDLMMNHEEMVNIPLQLLTLPLLVTVSVVQMVNSAQEDQLKLKSLPQLEIAQQDFTAITLCQQIQFHVQRELSKLQLVQLLVHHVLQVKYALRLDLLPQIKIVTQDISVLKDLYSLEL